MMNKCFIFILILNFTVYLINAVKTCPEQYQTYENGNKCFSFLPSRAQWITAEQACQQNDGKLATIENGFDEVFISSQAYSFYATYSDSDVWIGLNNLVDSNQYQWTDGSIPTFTDWGKGQPLTQGPYCVSQTFKDGSNHMQYWSSESCFDFKFFVCEWNGNLTDTTTTKTPPPPTTTSTTTTSTVTTTTLKPTVPTTKFLTNAPTTVENVETEAPEVATTVIGNDEASTPFLNPCDYNFTFSHLDERCYKVFDSRSVPDNDFEGACFLSFSGHLPSVHSPEQNLYIVNLVANAPDSIKNPNGFGIALGLQLVGNDWQWTDGSFVDFNYWDGGPSTGQDRSVIITDDPNNPDDHNWKATSHIQPVYAYVCYILPK